MNYDVVSETDVAEIGPAPEGTDLAIDEGHVVKNARTNRAKAVRAVAKAVEHAAGRRWIVTATPICNRPMELKAVLDAVGAFGTAFSSYSAFSRAFGGAVRSPRAEPTDAAGPALARVSLRRLKSDVAKDLPSKTIVRVPVQVDARVLALAADLEAKIRPAVDAAEAQARIESLRAQESDAAALARRVAAISRAFGVDITTFGADDLDRIVADLRETAADPLFRPLISVYVLQLIGSGLGYASMVYATVVITILSYLVWLHHFFTMGSGASVNTFFGITTMIISIPTGAKIFNWLFTMYKGRIRFELPMMWTVAFMVTFAIGGMTGGSTMQWWYTSAQLRDQLPSSRLPEFKAVRMYQE